MVASLADLCLISIRHGVENGKIRDLQLLSPSLRQSILDKILMRGKLFVNNQHCLSTLSSAEFLNGLWSLSTRCSQVDDQRFLKRVSKSMETITPNGKTIGDGVTKLKLNLYGDYSWEWEGSQNFTSSCSLIARCPNLVSLDLKVENICTYDDDANIDYDSEDDDIDQLGDNIFSMRSEDGSLGDGLLNRIEDWQPCLTVIENISELSLIGSYPCADLLTDRRPVLKFKNLKSLSLANSMVNAVAWRQLLTTVKGTLTHLNLKNIKGGNVSDNAHWILPFPLPELKSLKIDIDPREIRCDRFFVDNLKRCPKLEYVSLRLDNRIKIDENLVALNEVKAVFDINLELDLYVSDRTIADAMLDDSGNFKLVDTFKKKIKEFSFCGHEWNSNLTKALNNAIDVCQNLTSFRLMVACNDKNCQDLENVKSSLASLFGDEKRAFQLRSLSLNGPYEHDLLKSIFQNCVNLELLRIAECPQLVDEHLIDWVRRGARPSQLILTDCRNVSDNGLIPILFSSGGRLKTFEIWLPNESITDRTWRVLMENCRYVERVFIPDYMTDLFASKCFKND